jgi:5-methyltetrahydropteroyltriglutamate--homocysteine methyltransferase
MLARRLFPRLRVHRLLMEYDDARSGGFEPLRHLGEDRDIVLGLVTTKSGQIEPLDELVARVREASRHVPLERLAVSPQCGFASSVRGNRLTAAAQRRKLELVVRVAAEIWG